MNYELKHIQGIPYFLEGTTVRTFELQGGLPSPDTIPIGTYDADAGRITYFDDWFDRIQSRLTAFRGALVSHPRDSLRQSIDKPQKQRKPARNPRKAPSRAKNPASVPS